MNAKEEILDFYLKNIDPDANKDDVRCFLKKALVSMSKTKILIALNNFLDSRFYQSLNYKYPRKILSKTNLEKFLQFSLGYGSEYIEEIQKVSKWFVRFYNISIRSDYQEYMKYNKFISHEEDYDYIKKISCFIIKNKVKMAKMLQTKELKRITYVFVNTLFYVFNNNPPHLSQYLVDDEKFWEWFAISCEDSYIAYDVNEKSGVLDIEPVELKYSEKEIKDHEKNEKRNKKIYEDTKKPEWFDKVFKNND